MDHELKIIPPFYDDVKSGVKTFEVRRNDRNFQVGDLLHLKEWMPCIQCAGAGSLPMTGGALGPLSFAFSAKPCLECKETGGEFTGRTIYRKVVCMLLGPAFGVKNGYVVMGIR